MQYPISENYSDGKLMDLYIENQWQSKNGGNKEGNVIFVLKMSPSLAVMKKPIEKQFVRQEHFHSVWTIWLKRRTFNGRSFSKIIYLMIIVLKALEAAQLDERGYKNNILKQLSIKQREKSHQLNTLSARSVFHTVDMINSSQAPLLTLHLSHILRK